jgi:hypothetical protein
MPRHACVTVLGVSMETRRYVRVHIPKKAHSSGHCCMQPIFLVDPGGHTVFGSSDNCDRGNNDLLNTRKTEDVLARTGLLRVSDSSSSSSSSGSRSSCSTIIVYY